MEAAKIAELITEAISDAANGKRLNSKQVCILRGNGIDIDGIVTGLKRRSTYEQYETSYEAQPTDKREEGATCS